MGALDVFVGLGSNLGSREATLVAAASELEKLGFLATAKSSLYLTEPVGPAQPEFVNAVLGGTTGLAPEELLQAALFVEQRHGRVRAERNGPRTLDVDILLYGDVCRDTATLVLPHPRLAERRFVLVPLAEVAPNARHPLFHVDAATLLARCPDTSRVQRLSPWPQA